MKKKTMMAMTTALAIGMLAGCGEKDTATTDTNTSTPVATEASAPTEAEATPTEAEVTVTDTVSDAVEDAVTDIVYPGLNPELKELFENEAEEGEIVNISGAGFPKAFDDYFFEGTVWVDEETGYVYAESDHLAYFTDGVNETLGFVCNGELEIGGTVYKSDESKEGISDHMIIDLVTGKTTHTYFKSSGPDNFTYVDDYGILHENVSAPYGQYSHCFNALAERCGATVEVQ